MAVDVFDEAGKPINKPGVAGELVCTKPFPSQVRPFVKTEKLHNIAESS